LDEVKKYAYGLFLSFDSVSHSTINHFFTG